MSLNSNTNAGLLVLLIVAIILIVLGPLATIWSANTLFNLAIPYTFDTWVATLLMGAFFRGESIVGFNRKK